MFFVACLLPNKILLITSSQTLCNLSYCRLSFCQFVSLSLCELVNLSFCQSVSCHSVSLSFCKLVNLSTAVSLSEGWSVELSSQSKLTRVSQIKHSAQNAIRNDKTYIRTYVRRQPVTDARYFFMSSLVVCFYLLTPSTPIFHLLCLFSFRS